MLRGLTEGINRRQSGPYWWIEGFYGHSVFSHFLVGGQRAHTRDLGLLGI